MADPGRLFFFGGDYFFLAFVVGLTTKPAEMTGKWNPYIVQGGLGRPAEAEDEVGNAVAVGAATGAAGGEAGEGGEAPGAAAKTPPGVVGAQGKRLLIALPCYGGCHPHFMASMFGLLVRPPCKLTVRQHIGDSLVTRARNALCAYFLHGNWTHLLFLDTDLSFEPADIHRLLSHGEEPDIVGGLYSTKTPLGNWVLNGLPQGEDQGARPDGLREVLYLGTGMMLIARRVLEAMRKARPEIEYRVDDDQRGKDHGGDTQWDFFQVGTHMSPHAGRVRYLSEDWFFCQVARDLGFRIWADTRVMANHHGECAYPIPRFKEFVQWAEKQKSREQEDAGEGQEKKNKEQEKKSRRNKR